MQCMKEEIELFFLAQKSRYIVEACLKTFDLSFEAPLRI